MLTRREMIRHPQVAANALIIETEHPVAGRLRQTRPPARFSETRPEIRRGAPVLGEHTVEVLLEAGYDPAAVDAMLESGAALQAGDASRTEAAQ